MKIIKSQKHIESKSKKNRKIAQAISNILNGKSKQQAIKIVNNKVIPQEQIKGFFSDQSWEGVKQIWNAFNAAGLDWNIVGSSYRPNQEGKEWKIEINFVNDKGKPVILYGVVVAAGAGTIQDPLSRYDITAYVG